MFSFPTDDERVFAYVRVTTGDELSKRAKFALITWIGPSVGGVKKAKVSTDKAFVKQVLTVSKILERLPELFQRRFIIIIVDPVGSLKSSGIRSY